jgi:hypothetical protein
MEREKAQAHNFLHDAWLQSYYSWWRQYGPNLWCNLVQWRSHRPSTTFLWYRSASSTTSPGSTDERRRRCHPQSTRRARLGSTNMIFLFPGKIFRSKEQYWEENTMRDIYYVIDSRSNANTI